MARSARSARIDTVLGDARLSLEKQSPNGFGLLAIDAFSGDSIPVHLLTREALATHRRHISSNGVIAFSACPVRSMARRQHRRQYPLVRQGAANAASGLTGQALHVSNRFLELAPVVGQLAQEQNMHAVLIRDQYPAAPSTSSDWVLVTNEPERLRHPAIAEAAQPVPVMPGVGVWTDDTNNLFKILK